MHFVRRAALRAASAPSTSFIFKSRSITTSPFALRTKASSSITQQIPRRFYSEEKSGENNNGEQGTVSQAINSAKEYASEAADSAKGAFESATETASAYVPRAFGGRDGGDRRSGGFQRRDDGRERRPYNDRGGYGGNRGDRGGFGGDRGGFGGDRGGDRRGPRDAPLVVTPTTNVYVGNLLFDVAATDLEREFSQFGTITKAHIAQDDRGLSKGFGYVHFETVEQAAAAIEAKHQSVLEGRRIVVNYMIQNGPRNGGVPADPSKTIFIGNIPFEMSDADLNKLFRGVKNVVDIRVAIDRRTGQPRGFAHADFRDIDSAVAGKSALVDQELYGRKLRVDFSASVREREPRTNRE